MAVAIMLGNLSIVFSLSFGATFLLNSSVGKDPFRTSIIRDFVVCAYVCSDTHLVCMYVKSESVALAHLFIWSFSLYINSLMSDSENEGGRFSVISTSSKSACVSDFENSRMRSCLRIFQVLWESGAPLKLAIKAGRMVALRSILALATFKQAPSN